MFTVVLGVSGVSTAWLLVLAWRLARALWLGRAGLRGPGTIRLWLGAIVVLACSSALEAGVAPNPARNALGRATASGLAALAGKPASVAVAALLLIAALPWLFGARWPQCLAYLDRTFGLGLGLGARAGNATRDERRAWTARKRTPRSAPALRKRTPRNDSALGQSEPYFRVAGEGGFGPNDTRGKRASATRWPEARQAPRDVGARRGFTGPAAQTRQDMSRSVARGTAPMRDANTRVGAGVHAGAGANASAGAGTGAASGAKRTSPVRAVPTSPSLPAQIVGTAGVAALRSTSANPGTTRAASARSISATSPSIPPGRAAGAVVPTTPTPRSLPPRTPPRHYRPADNYFGRSSASQVPAASRAEAIDGVVTPPPPSDSIGATLRAIEQQAAQWTTLADASLTRQERTGANAATGAPELASPSAVTGPAAIQSVAAAAPVAPAEPAEPAKATSPAEAAEAAHAADAGAPPFGGPSNAGAPSHSGAPANAGVPSNAGALANAGTPAEAAPRAEAAALIAPASVASAVAVPIASAAVDAIALTAEPSTVPAPAAPRVGTGNEFAFQAPAASYVDLPGLDLLASTSDAVEPVSEESLAATGQLIEQRLKEFKVPVAVIGASAGPVITRFEVEPALGVRGSQIVGLMKDLSRGLGLTSIRVVETIPGKTCMGLELPNAQRQTIRLAEIVASNEYRNSASQLTIAMGKDITGYPVVTDLARAPHMLVAGTTGSGKSVAINAMILSLLFKATPQDVRLIMIDPKMLELSVYEGIPHLLAPVVTDMKLAANALTWCVAEMEKRYRLMSALGVRNLAGFNLKIRDAERAERRIGNPFSLTPDAPEPLSPLPTIVVIIDELADLMMVAGKKIEELIARLAQKARAAGIHLILATQRPSVDVITGLIKANIPTRVAFQVSSKVDSRTILDQMGAESLLGQGDMLFLPPGTGYPQRVHGAFVADDEVHRVVEYLKQFGEPEYEESILAGVPGENAANDLFGEAPDAEADPLYDEAVAFVLRSRRASISSVQRQLRIGYNRAARLVEQMEAAGLVSPMGINGSREVLAPGPAD